MSDFLEIIKSQLKKEVSKIHILTQIFEKYAFSIQTINEKIKGENTGSRWISRKLRSISPLKKLSLFVKIQNKFVSALNYCYC